MHELTIDDYKLFILKFNSSNRQSFAKAFASDYATDNKELLEIKDNKQAREYIFRKYLVH